MINKSITRRLSFYILLFVTALGLTTILVNYYFSQETIVRSSEENAKNLTLQVVHEIESILNSVEKVPELIASGIEQGVLDEKELHQLIKNVVSKYPEVFGSAVAFEPNSFDPAKYYYSIYYYKNNDKVDFQDLGTVDYDYLHQDWYQIPKELNKVYWSEPYFDEGGGDALMSTYSCPFYRNVNGEKKLWGIVTVDISLIWLQEKVNQTKIMNDSYAFMITQAGSIVTHPDKEFIMNETIFTIASENDQPDIREIGKKMINRESNFDSFYSKRYNEKSFIYYSPLPSNNWSLAIVFPESELFAGLRTLTVNLIIIAIVGFILLLSIIIITANKITKPLRTFVGVTEKIGAGNLEIEIPETDRKDEIGILSNSFVSMQKQLKDYINNLQETTKAKERIESELKIAHKIQMGMIPKLFPPFPNRPEIDIYAVLEPAREVGGDLYDFFFIDEYKLCFVVGDVSGKGVPASLMMAVTRTLLRSKANKNYSTADLVNLLNKDLKEDNESQMFVTFFIGILDIQTGNLQYTNAGHNFPYIVRKDGNIEPLKNVHGLPLGLFVIQDYIAETVQLNSNDRIVLYTDGITEAMNKENEEYGDERFIEMLKDTHNLSVQEDISKILKNVKEFAVDTEPSDDLTLMEVIFRKTEL